MPYAPHVRVTARGEIRGNTGGKREEFQYGLNLASTSPLDLGFVQAQADDIAADVSAFHGRAATLIQSTAVLTEVKIAFIGADGKYTRDPQIVGVNVPGGSTATPQQYPQIALAVSLNTDRRGPTGKGRFYLPQPRVGLDPATYLIPVGEAEGIRGSVQTLLNDLNNAAGPDFTATKVVVASTKGYNTEVTGVRVGRVLDTMRSRREKLQENYTAILPL